MKIRSKWRASFIVCGILMAILYVALVILPFELYGLRASVCLPGPGPGYLSIYWLGSAAYILSFQEIAWVWLILQGFLLTRGIVCLPRARWSWVPYVMVSGLLVWEASYPRVIQTTLNAILE